MDEELREFMHALEKASAATIGAYGRYLGKT